MLAARRPSGRTALPERPEPASDAQPKAPRESDLPEPSAPRAASQRPPRAARIVATREGGLDLRLRDRERLLARLIASQGRSAVTRAADEYRNAGFEFPEEQLVQLQLLEHVDEALARTALETLTRLISREAPLKRPVFEQRLRRLEGEAEEEATRRLASELRRALRG